LFPELLRENGYWVGLEGRHHHLDGKLESKEAPHILEALNQMRMKELDERLDYVNVTKTKGAYLAKVAERFSQTLDEVPENKPFFLYFGFNQPHRKFGDDHEGIDPKELLLPPDFPDLPGVRLDYARYLAEVRDLDAGIGFIERILRERGLKESTMVIFMGDNGEALLRGKGTLYRRGLNVPLMVRWPGKVRAGAVKDALVSGVDIAPTILEAAGLEKNRNMTGVSFLPLLKGQNYKGRQVIFAERGWHHGQITRTNGLDFSRSVVTKKYNYIYNALPDRVYTPVDMEHKNVAWEEIKRAHDTKKLKPLHEKLFFLKPRPIFELYDKSKDPHELHNLAGSAAFRDIETELRQELDKEMIRESDYLPLPSHVFDLLNQKRKMENKTAR
ncbi:MAG: sulfatase-like hydrolase/transferase, partial [Planctomycetes bacterium]|nr:sulfatase-like hydrolase/transferase [Planctomycetota bacterium]